MKFTICDLRFTSLLVLMGLAVNLAAAETNAVPQPIDLPTALRLAGAQNLDVQMAREKVAEARAEQENARAQFFPWISPGIGYRRHDNRIQDVAGNLIDVNKQSYSVGATLTAQVDLGEAWFKTLSARQTALASEHQLAAQQQQSILAAALAYFELARAQSAARVAAEAVKNSEGYSGQLQRAIEAGLAHKGELLRVNVQLERNRLAIRRAEEQQRIAAARLAQVLRLDPAVELLPVDAELAPLTLVATNRGLGSLIAEALGTRPELKQADALMLARHKEKTGAAYGPLVPSLGAQVFAGGLGGGVNDDMGNFGDSQSYQLQLSWRIGPGGLFDPSRRKTTDARWRTATFATEKISDDIARQVVEAWTRTGSLGDQIVTTRRALASAEEALKLARDRREFGVAIVLENILAEQELTAMRQEYVNAVAEYNKAQYGLLGAIGEIIPASQPATR